MDVSEQAPERETEHESLIMDLRGKDLKKVLAELLREEDVQTLTLGAFMQKFAQALRIDSARAEEYKPKVAEVLDKLVRREYARQTVSRAKKKMRAADGSSISYQPFALGALMMWWLS